MLGLLTLANFIVTEGGDYTRDKTVYVGSWAKSPWGRGGAVWVYGISVAACTTHNNGLMKVS